MNESQKKKKKPDTGLWIFAACCFLIFVGGLSFWLSSRGSSQKEADVQTRSVTLTDVGFDTPVTFSATCSEEDFALYLNTVIETFTRYNQLFDQYNAYDGVNNIYTLNEKAASEKIEVDPLIIECIEDSMKAAAINPKFDISEGHLLSLWHDIRESDSPVLPSQEELEKAREHTGMEGIVVDGNTISFADDSISLDLGAIAKGFTAQKCKELLEDQGMQSGFINAGGNVVLIGTKTDEKSWNIGITKPDTSDSLVQFITDTPTSLVTSGDYQRYVEIGGKRYSHIIDPETGYPAEYVRSVTVIDEDSAWADAMSTALYCMSVQDGLEVCKEQNLSAVWFTDAGSLDLKPDFTTQGFDVYITPDLKEAIRPTADDTAQ